VRPHPSDGSGGFRVATFNVNSVRARLPVLLPWLKRERPHVVCLQETKVRDPLFPAAAFAGLGYHASFRGVASHSGVALLSTEEPDDVRFGLDDGGPADGDRLVAARIRGISIVNTYVPQGRDPADPLFAYKLTWISRLGRYVGQHFAPEDPVLWLGDFNVAPESIDVHDPVRLVGHVGFHPDERAALARVKAWGFVDVFRQHVPGPGQYTFWDYRAADAVARRKGWRVDHIWATSCLAQRSRRAWIDTAPRLADRPSDHTPVLAEFDL
jgi:exodeoxyribonuclease-3